MLDNRYSDHRRGSIRNKYLFRYYAFNKLLKLQYPQYYKYSVYVYRFLLKKYSTLMFRTYLQNWPYHITLLPYYQFIKGIHLRDVSFYEQLNNYPHTMNFFLNKKI